MGPQRVRKLKIGYWPLSENLRATGDRRRLIFWANTRGHEIVTNLDRNVDVTVATINADFNSPHIQTKNVPLIFDLVDAYLSPLSRCDDLARGFAKRFSGQVSGVVKPFSHHVRDLCRLSDAVICSSPEQEEVIKQHNFNTHVILDSHDEISFINPIRDKAQKTDRQKLLWEGQPATIRGVKNVYPSLLGLARTYNLDFDFVTDKNYFLLLNKYLKKSTLELLKKDLHGIANRVNVIPWSPSNLVDRAQKSAVAMIPIDLTIPMQRLKPENRLLIMWRLGLPCLTSPSPAYVRVANQAGVNSICYNQKEWIENFIQILEDPNFAYSQSLAGQSYVRENHNTKILLKKWDSAFDSVMG
jgi:hypothetical protein